MLRSLALIFSGNVTSSLLLLARNLLVARLISVEDYGIAATFAIAMTLVEMSSDLGLKQQIVQSQRGDDPHFQAALQGFQVLRAVLMSVLLFAISGWLAAYFGVPDLTWAYQVVAVVPILYAVQHFDIHRLNRQMSFGPMIAASVVPALVSLLAIWPFALWFGDYRVMLYALVLHAGAGAVVSHIVAERPFRMVLDREIMAGSLRFGWPLLLNGLLLFSVFQGDKLIVGGQLGLEALAIFAMGVTLTLTPTLVMSKTVQSFTLPILSRRAATRDSAPAAFDGMAHAVLQAGVLNGIVLAGGVWLVGPPVVLLLLGEKYAPVLPLLVWFAIQQGLRVFKSGPAVVALATGHTSNPMYANLVRVAVLPLALLAVIQGGDLRMVLLIGILGEGLGLALALGLIRRRPGLSLRRSAPALILSGLFLAALAAVSWWPATGALGQLELWGPVVLFALACAAMRDLWRYLRHRRAGQD